MSKLLII